MPEYEGAFITATELLKTLKRAEARDCLDSQNEAILTILDLRATNAMGDNGTRTMIKTRCPTLKFLLDDLQKPGIRKAIPRRGLVAIITETGNRDLFAMRYLRGFGYTNIVGLRFGMRGWIKLAYPVTAHEPCEEKR